MLLPIALVMAAAFQWGLAGGLAGQLMTSGWSPELLTFWRLLVGLLCMLAWVAVIRLQGYSLNLTRPLVAWSALAGLGVTGNLTFYFISISEASVAVAVTLMYSAPVMVYFVSFARGTERPTTLKLGAIAAIVVGVVLLTGLYRTTPGAFSLWGVLAGLLSGISYSVFIFAFKSAGSHGRTPVSLTVAFMAAVLALAFLVDPAQAVSVPLSPDAPLFLLFGLIGAGLSFLCYFIGLRGVLPTMAAVVAMIEPVTATLYGVIGLGEALSLAEVLGMIIILSSVTALTVMSHRESVR
ncbi:MULTISPECIES: EamA family transporter [Spiribacter]|uniref:DMT family transporter n=2 Tax=Spiribacter TaxID=1335745 RepID=A0A557RFM9_9GAMM|nr:MULTISPECIES: DMT family transporter [Spiribacter]AUB79421.1 hypothetical protein BBH56_05295 [Spiribacter roseus]KAF0281020.1 hypothetical protein BA897_07500 [Spiribacter roseus]KAF0282149.1 hypothetical protein BA900_01780 [Spiribacter roseus]KAF0284644.1 hypothetical protein BA898_07125 [Spiribacter roseus]KAF0285481.1 hypothetical protein BA899_00370 [Spiribacter sp. SSL99]